MSRDTAGPYGGARTIHVYYGDTAVKYKDSDRPRRIFLPYRGLFSFGVCVGTRLISQSITETFRAPYGRIAIIVVAADARAASHRARRVINYLDGRLVGSRDST